MTAYARASKRTMEGYVWVPSYDSYYGVQMLKGKEAEGRGRGPEIACRPCFCRRKVSPDVARQIPLPFVIRDAGARRTSPSRKPAQSCDRLRVLYELVPIELRPSWLLAVVLWPNSLVRVYR